MSNTGFRGRTLSLVTASSDVAFYAQRDYGRSVLLLGAADGRLSFELGARNLAVTAVEPSQAMFQLAEERKAEERPETAAHVQLIHGDLRAVRLSREFDAVIAPQNAVGLLQTLDDLDAFLETAKVHLAPSGTLVFDLVNPGPPIPGDREGLPPALTFVPHLHERQRKDSTEGIRRMKVRPFTVDDVDEALTAAGFVALERFGGFDGKPFDPTDPLQIVVASKDPYGLKH